MLFLGHIFLKLYMLYMLGHITIISKFFKGKKKRKLNNLNWPLKIVYQKYLTCEHIKT